jgi:hypothetical protein
MLYSPVGFSTDKIGAIARGLIRHQKSVLQEHLDDGLKSFSGFSFYWILFLVREMIGIAKSD